MILNKKYKFICTSALFLVFTILMGFGYSNIAMANETEEIGIESSMQFPGRGTFFITPQGNVVRHVSNTILMVDDVVVDLRDWSTRQRVVTMVPPGPTESWVSRSQALTPLTGGIQILGIEAVGSHRGVATNNNDTLITTLTPNALKVRVTNFNILHFFYWSSNHQLAQTIPGRGSDQTQNIRVEPTNFDNRHDYFIIDLNTGRVVDVYRNNLHYSRGNTQYMQGANRLHDRRFTPTPGFEINPRPISELVTDVAPPSGLTINMEEERLMGANSQMQFSTNGGASWTNFTTTNPSISSVIQTSTNPTSTMLVRYQATSTSVPSPAVEITVPTRLPVPTVWFDGITESINANDTMEFRAGTTGNWIPVEQGATSVSVALSPAAATTYQVRAMATEDRFASNSRSITVPMRLPAPNVTYSGITDTITGVSTAMEFSLNGGETWRRATGTTLTRADFGQNEATVYIRTAATTTQGVSEVAIVNVPGGFIPAPTGLEIDYAREVITGVAPGMQHSTNGTTWTNITGTELNIASMIPASNASANTTLRIRTAATASAPASIATQITLTRRPATPTASNVRFDGFTESISVNDTMEFRAGAGDWTPVAPGQTSVPVNLTTANVIHQVRFRGTEGTFPSAAINVTVPRRPVAPNVNYWASSDTITGLLTAMEFSLNGGETWTRSTGTTLTRAHFGQDATTVYVRTLPTATQPVSEVRVIDVPSGPASAPTGFEIDYAREVITGVAPGMQHSTNGTTWTNITGTELNIASMIPASNGSNVNLRIRTAATPSAPASIPAEITLTRRQATPTSANARFDGFTESIILNDTMEFRRGTSGDWTQVEQGQTSVPVTPGTSAVTHQIRVRGTESAFPSLPLSISVPRRPAAPNANYVASSDTITGVSTAMEFSLDRGETWTRATGTTLTRADFGQDATTVYVRALPTATAAVSEVRVINVPNGPAPAPTGFEIDYAREVITGVAPGMQHSTNGTSWTNITGTELNIANIIPASNANSNVNLRIRTAPTASTPPSIPAEITLTRRQATPTSVNARFDGFTESIIVNDTMEFRRGTSGDWTQVAQGQTSIPVTPGTSTLTYQVRIRSTESAFVSLPLSVSVPRRPGAPNANYVASSDTITGVSTAMEFSLDRGETWTRSTGTTLTRAHFGQDAITVYVRTAATATAPSSAIRVIDVPQAGRSVSVMPPLTPEEEEIDVEEEEIDAEYPNYDYKKI